MPVGPTNRSSWAPDLVIALAPVLLGGSLYLFWRPANLLMFDAIRALGMAQHLDLARTVVQHWAPLGPGFVRDSLPTGLWAFSLVYCIEWIWRHSGSEPLRFAHVAIGMAIAVAVEALQLVGLPGTFDLLDLAANLAGAALAEGVAYVRNAQV